MNETDVIEIIRAYISGQFPRKCSCCEKQFDTFLDFIRQTSYVGKPISYDADEGDFQPENPIGTLGMVNCSCGTTLALSTKDMDLTTMWQLLEWVKAEMKRRDCDASDLLADVRRKIDAIELREGEK